MNVLNVIWAFLAELIGIVFTWVSLAVFYPLIGLMTTVGTVSVYMLMTQIICYLGVSIFVIMLMFVIPIAIMMTDESALPKMNRLFG